MTEWRWVSAASAVAIHLEQLTDHGGGAGVRDEGLLLSALARPKNAASYAEPDAAALAASYAFGIARNHPFIDGDKRTAWVVARLFLAKNSVALRFKKADAAVQVLTLAAGEMSEYAFANWLRAQIVPARA
ncbi:MAG: type II toxin-antitoxin system death-on-curing family toxin [Sphingomicrobium sp.]